jgi:flagellar basal body-associated protein FliL
VEQRGMGILWIILIVLLVLVVLGYFGRGRFGAR